MNNHIQQYQSVCSRILSMVETLLGQQFPQIPFSMQGKRGNFWIGPAQGDFSSHPGRTFHSKNLRRHLCIYYSEEEDGSLAPWRVGLTCEAYNFTLYLHPGGYYVYADRDYTCPRDTTTISLSALQTLAGHLSELVEEHEPDSTTPTISVWPLLPEAIAQEAVDEITHSGSSIEEMIERLAELCGEKKFFYNPHSSPPAITALRGVACTILSRVTPAPQG